MSSKGPLSVENQLSRSRDILQIPPHLLRAAYLLGRIPFRACRSDPRISYSLYIPEQYKRVHAALQQKDLEEIPARLPLLVNVHGTRREASKCRDSLIDFADRNGVAILAPLFPAGLDNYLDLDGYKNLRSRTLQADAVLLDILNEVSHMFPGIATDPVIMVGFSGGAQFVHRFMYLNPERISAAVVAAPGSVTKLGNKGRWPEGLRDVEEVFGGQEVDVQGIRGVEDVLLIVGEEDGEEEQSETLELQRWLAERKTNDGEDDSRKRLERPKSRREVLKGLKRDWEERGIEVDFVNVPGVGHSYDGIVPAVIEWLKECQAVVEPAA